MYESITSAFDDNTETRMASSSPSKWVSCIMTKDSTHAFTIIKQPRQDSHRYAFIVEGIKDFLKENLRVQLVHTLREGNMCVNFLAKLDPNLGDSLTEISTPPLELVELLTPWQKDNCPLEQRHLSAVGYGQYYEGHGQHHEGHDQHNEGHSHSTTPQSFSVIVFYHNSGGFHHSCSAPNLSNYLYKAINRVLVLYLRRHMTTKRNKTLLVSLDLDDSGGVGDAKIRSEISWKRGLGR
ncbi:hypothetical protein D0Y65_046805 [Glycine soja]|uniref:RNase H type-1 domain-containing protein n=1 Tax=Glycine soja TaxID=3848 RepID=A0A445GB19_GLYSO|nr:hypothetical protein D0Y65_046805 [Glycine soja]